MFGFIIMFFVTMVIAGKALNRGEYKYAKKIESYDNDGCIYTVCNIINSDNAVAIKMLENREIVPAEHIDKVEFCKEDICQRAQRVLGVFLTNLDAYDRGYPFFRFDDDNNSNQKYNYWYKTQKTCEGYRIKGDGNQFLSKISPFSTQYVLCEVGENGLKTNEESLAFFLPVPVKLPEYKKDCFYWHRHHPFNTEPISDNEFEYILGQNNGNEIDEHRKIIIDNFKAICSEAEKQLEFTEGKKTVAFDGAMIPSLEGSTYWRVKIDRPDKLFGDKYESDDRKCYTTLICQISDFLGGRTDWVYKWKNGLRFENLNLWDDKTIRKILEENIKTNVSVIYSRLWSIQKPKDNNEKENIRRTHDALRVQIKDY